jgi:hypothetical protein
VPGILLAEALSKRLNTRIKWFINEQTGTFGLYETGAKERFDPLSLRERAF